MEITPNFKFCAGRLRGASGFIFMGAPRVLHLPTQRSADYAAASILDFVEKPKTTPKELEAMLPELLAPEA